MIYNVNGIAAKSDFSENMAVSYGYDATSQTNYTVVRVFQTKRDGTKQYPFIRYAGFCNPETLLRKEGWGIVMNAGLGWDSEIDGPAIENGVVLHNPVASYHVGTVPLTIDENGVLSTALATETGTEILAKGGIVSATNGFCPIILDYEPTESFAGTDQSVYTSAAMRSILGQFGNGDYALIVCAGRNNDNSVGWTLAQAQTVCQQLGLKFAYNMDGGKSTALFLEGHPVYNFPAGTFRIVPSYVVFNGSDTFSIPEVRS